MHEMSLIRNVVDMVLQECEGKNVKEVKAVHLTIGELSDVVEQYIPGLFKHLASKQESKIAANAEVIIKRTPLLVRCNECYEIFHINVHDDSTWVCPRCNARQNYSLFSGREFRIDNIEVELFSPEEIAAQQAAAAEAAAAEPEALAVEEKAE